MYHPPSPAGRPSRPSPRGSLLSLAACGSDPSPPTDGSGSSAAADRPEQDHRLLAARRCRSPP